MRSLKCLPCLGGSEGTKPSCNLLFHRIVVGIAGAIEKQWPLLEVPVFPSMGAALSWTRRKDPALRRQLVFGCISKKLRAAGKKNKGSRKHTSEQHCDHYDKVAEQRRYFRSGLRAMDGARQVALALDGSRLGHRERLLGCMMNLDNGATLWVPPQATGVATIPHRFRASEGMSRVLRRLLLGL